MASFGKILSRINCSMWKSANRTTKNLLSKEFSESGKRSMASHDTIGFVGLGNMGNHMAKNLITKGYKLVIYDVSQNAMEYLKGLEECKDFVTFASSPSEVAVQCQNIITMLPASQQVHQVYTADNGIFSSIQTESLLIDSSTIDPSVSEEMAALAAESSSMYVDAPVSGGVNAARDAALTFMVGGTQKSFDLAQRYLSIMGRNVVHCGPVGTGQAAKICNNMLLAISMIGTSEAMNLGTKLGLDPKLLAKILNTSSGRCWSSEVYNPCPGVLEGVPSSNEYRGGFGTALMTKDLGLAQNAATVTKSPIPLGGLAHQMYRIMTSSGYAKKDFSSAYQFLQDQQEKDKS